jgi:hypothetical protein
MGNLRLVDWYNHGQDSDSDACDKTTNVKHCDYNAGRLDDTADNEDATCREYSATAAKTVGVRGDKSATEASCCE